MTDLVPTSDLYLDLAKSENTTSLMTGTATFIDADIAEAEHARLDLEIRGQLRFRYPETMTQAEAAETLAQLARRFGARGQCHLVIRSIPDDVVPIILPQLQEMAEYEVRMWHVQQEVEGPDIHERWISLPASTA